jgi:hypothetical protein
LRRRLSDELRRLGEMERSEVVVVMVAALLVLDGSPYPPSFESIDDEDDDDVVVVLLHFNLVGPSPTRCLFGGFLGVDAAEGIIWAFVVCINAALLIYIFIYSYIYIHLSFLL